MPTERIFEDESRETAGHLIEHRLPWLLLGLLGGILTSVIVAQYEAILAADVRLAFFMPIVVYLSDAVGTQSETIFVRTLAHKQVRFARYLLKESAIGVGLGLIFGIILGCFAAWWLASSRIGVTIGITMFINLSLSPALAVYIPRLLYREHFDPALGAGPVATIIQDLLSLLVYFGVASMIIF